MKIVISSDKKGLRLKNSVVQFLLEHAIPVEDLSPLGEETFYDASIQVVEEVRKSPSEHKGIIIDEYGVGSFMVADKFKYIICAELNDEHSAKMTRDHNNANIITMGSGVIGEDIACRIALRFCEAQYSGGRHQIRVDMLNKMC